MEAEGILLRHTGHLESLVSLLNNQNFAEKHGDIKLVFTDGHLFHYKAVLAGLSPSLGQVVGNCTEADLVLFDNVEKAELFSHVFIDSAEEIKCEGDNDMEDVDTTVNNYYHSDHQYHFTQEDRFEEKPQLANLHQITNIHTKKTIEQTVATEKICEMDRSSFGNENNNIEKKVVSSVVSDFSWPAHLSGPNYHSIRWGQHNKSISVYEVMGNRSIFTLLSEKHKDLPCSTPFSFRSVTGEKETSGIFSLKEFVNGGTDMNIPAFIITGTETKMTLIELMDYMGCERINRNKIRCLENITQTQILLNREYKDLKNLIEIWKEDIITDSSEQELVGGSSATKYVIAWLQTQASKTLDGEAICSYCGLVCCEQSVNANFQYHMKKHLNRRKFCKPCKEYYSSHETHLCSSVKPPIEVKKFPCAECGKVSPTRGNLIRHLRTVHKIIEKVIILRECVFCLKKVPDISKHCLEFHRNETLSCKYCERVFTNPTKFRTHVNYRHLKVNSGFCNICQKDCPNLTQHNRICHNKKNFPCDHCEKVFKHPKSLADHMKSVNGTLEKKPCPECGNLYVNLSSHISRFHRGVRYTSKVRNCMACGKSIRKEEFADHKLTCKEEETICHICSKKVIQISRHLAKHHQIFERRCYICDKDFNTVTDLNKHLRSEYLPKILAGAGFTKKDLQPDNALQREQMATKVVELYSWTSEGGQVECRFCKYNCATSTNMMVHMKEHLGFTFRKGKQPSPLKEKVCPDCGKLVRGMKAHLQKCREKLDNLVIKEVPFPDGVLNEPTDEDPLFSEDILVEMQVEVVTVVDNDKDIENVKAESKKTIKLLKESNFQCEKCNKSFEKIGYLRKHEKRQHGKTEEII